MESNESILDVRLNEPSLTDVNVTSLVNDNKKKIDSEESEYEVEFSSKQIDVILNKVNDLQNFLLSMERDTEKY